MLPQHLRASPPGESGWAVPRTSASSASATGEAAEKNCVSVGFLVGGKSAMRMSVTPKTFLSCALLDNIAAADSPHVLLVVPLGREHNQRGGDLQIQCLACQDARSKSHHITHCLADPGRAILEREKSHHALGNAPQAHGWTGPPEHLTHPPSGTLASDLISD